MLFSEANISSRLVVGIMSGMQSLIFDPELI